MTVDAWPEAKLRWITSLYYGDALPPEARHVGEVPVMGSNGQFDTYHSANLQGPCIIVGRKGSHGKVNWSSQPAWVTDTAFGIDRTKTETHLRWLYYALQTLPLAATSQDTGVPGLSREKAYEFRLRVPPLDTQRRVADMLDVETARIDTLIKKNQEALALASKHEAVAISSLLGDSGLHRPGRHSVGQLKWMGADIQTGPFGSQLHADEYIENGWPVCNPSNLVGGRLVADPLVTVDTPTHERLERHHLLPGDLVFGRRGEMGRAALVTEAERGWICGTGSLRVRLDGSRLVPAFLLELLSSWGVRAWFEQMALGSTMSNLNEEILGRLPVPSVPLETQRKLLEEADEVRARHASVRQSRERMIGLLQLRRQALTSAAVTGQIEV